MVGVRKGLVKSVVNNYINVLEDGLKKKRDILSNIQKASKAQHELLQMEKLDVDAFDRLVDEKDGYIKELEKLDEGFEMIYDRIKEELLKNKSLYAEQIKRMQSLIGEVTEKSVSIQAQESRNRDMVTAYFQQERQNLGKVKKSTKAAYGYYQNAGKSSPDGSYFMDTKK